MTYDNTDTNADGEIEAPVNNESVSTEGLYNGTQWTDYYIPHYATGDGTEDNPWTDGWNAAMEDIPQGHETDDTLARLVAPAGHYELTKTVEMKKGIRRRKASADINEENVVPLIQGAGRYSTSIYLPDNVDDDMFRYEPSDIVDDGEYLVGGGMADLTLVGNRANQTQGDVINIAPRPDGGRYIQSVWRDLFLRLGKESIFADRGGVINETEFRNVTFNRSTDDDCVAIGTNSTATSRLVFNECKFIFADNGNNGLTMSLANGEATFQACRFRNNAGHQLQVNGGDPMNFVGCEWVVDSGDGTGSQTDKAMIVVRNDDCEFHGYVDGGGERSNAVRIDSSADDADLDLRTTGLNGDIIKSDDGTRTRWRGVIGGGPLGGVDLSSTTGQYDGDKARADGSSTATANAEATWNGTGWDYRNPDGTV